MPVLSRAMTFILRVQVATGMPVLPKPMTFVLRVQVATGMPVLSKPMTFVLRVQVATGMPVPPHPMTFILRVQVAPGKPVLPKPMTSVLRVQVATGMRVPSKETSWCLEGRPAAAPTATSHLRSRATLAGTCQTLRWRGCSALARWRAALCWCAVQLFACALPALMPFSLAACA